MQESGDLRAGVLVGEAVVGDECVGLQHGLQPLVCVTTLVAEVGELGEVGGDLAFVPGDQDRLDVGEVLVQRGPSDAGGHGPRRHASGDAGSQASVSSVTASLTLSGGPGRLHVVWGEHR
jgi:hypothetical protein